MADLHVEDPQFGACGGDADDSAAFAAALSQAGIGGRVRYSKRHRVPQGLNIPPYVRLEGPLTTVGQSHPIPFTDLPGLVLNPNNPIKLGRASAFANGVVAREGLQPWTTESQARQGLSEFAGTALESSSSDNLVEDVLVLGFENTYRTPGNGAYRVNLRRVRFDTTNGIEIRNSHDISRITDCHGWPYLTAHRGFSDDSLLLRSGRAYFFHSISDWTQIHGCFSYGYRIGFRLHHAASCRLVDSSSDGPSINYESYGVCATGDTFDLSIVAGNFINKKYSLYFDLADDRQFVDIASTNVASAHGSALVVNKGSVSFTSGSIRSCQHVATVNNPNSHVHLGKALRLHNIHGQPIINNVGSNRILNESLRVV